MTFFDQVTRMKRMLVKANECYNKGKSRKAADLAHRGLSFAPKPEEAMTPEIRRLGSDLAALASLAYGRLESFQDAEMWAHNSVLRDGTNPFAYEALGLGRAMNGHTVDARAKFMEGLRLAREAQPVDTEAEERINGQLLWLNEHESKINDLYHFQERHRQLQRAAVTAARTELEKDWCADVISSYKTAADRSIVTMAFAAYILFVMERAFSKVFFSDQATDAVSLVVIDFATQPWYEPRAFSRIAATVSEQTSKRFALAIEHLVKCANACGYTLMPQAEHDLNLKGLRATEALFHSMMKLASSHSHD
jgi:hypothetical protein